MLQILVEEIHEDTPGLTRDVGKGYLCRFTSELGSGEALLATGAADPLSLAGQEILVTARPESVVDLRPLPPGSPEEPRLTALQEPGDFEAAGQVRSVVWLSDEAGEAVVEIQAGPLLFTVEAGEHGTELEYGQWVKIHIQGLAFFPL